MGVLANRLRKRYKHFAKWARRQGIGSFRIYHHDIPEYPLIVDYYEGYVVAWLSKRTRDVTPQEIESFSREVQSELLEGLQLSSPEKLFLKERRPGGQYRQQKGRSHPLTVQEGGLTFKVDLGAYHDTGLFLDHRLLRQRVAQEVEGRSFLNLFCYTGSFTVYAAAAGAKSTTSVDLSRRYLDWCEENLALNDLHTERQTLIEADTLDWLDWALQRGERYQLIVCDPPTFSNSKSTRALFEVQRDHRRLLEGCWQLLEPGGTLYFSTNKRNFQLELEAKPQLEMREITAQTTSPDFAAHPLHRAWSLHKKLIRCRL